MELFRHAKALGQNFIQDPQVLADIVEASGLSECDLAIEIGPGMGVLTAEAADAAARVVCIEIDERLIPILHRNLAGYLNVEILQGDILQTDLAALIARECEGKNYAAVRMLGNLPYYITTPILMKVLEAHLPIESFTVMVQKEVAERLAAGCGSRECGAITAIVQYYCEVEYVRTVDRTLFRPAPKVDSAVLQLRIRKTPPVSVRDEATLFELIKTSFLQRRKTLQNGLTGLRGLDKAGAGELLARAGVDCGRRAETLSLAEFAAIADALLDLQASGE